MILPPVIYDDVTAHYEGDAEELGSQSYVEAKIRHTIGKLKSRYGSRIAARLASGAIDEDLYIDTVAEAVLRVVRNPDGYTTEQQGNYSYGLRASVASGYLMFTSENLLDLVGESFQFIGTATISDHRVN
ncbi:Gp19/Gp15/Gp42 family protein [Leucobacter sp. Z1108]|uniref:Gp19/Gp15/Gp42 family protein n=1 Tax=Leucobacter sp. Z1108 TaxID=3439066 RepID=UPI003F5025B1